jgi:hypothetical protein
LKSARATLLSTRTTSHLADPLYVACFRELSSPTSQKSWRVLVLLPPTLDRAVCRYLLGTRASRRIRPPLRTRSPISLGTPRASVLCVPHDSSIEPSWRTFGAGQQLPGLHLSLADAGRMHEPPARTSVCVQSDRAEARTARLQGQCRRNSGHFVDDRIVPLHFLPTFPLFHLFNFST